ncbi:hypothetical protein EVAR_49376_1 [Eumeta japonica]|uniref:Uncharacterized protein n=1 Tax=Eumeta variegata TaxID=151549 RepID=A0A4C1XUB7_EUMVA|nr:hypothetical protein EVAR_49376_1 [Eumeta japonica]
MKETHSHECEAQKPRRPPARGSLLLYGGPFVCLGRTIKPFVSGRRFGADAYLNGGGAAGANFRPSPGPRRLRRAVEGSPVAYAPGIVSADADLGRELRISLGSCLN